MSSSCTKKDELRNRGRVGDGNILSAVMSLSECGVVVTTVGITKLSEGKNISDEESGRTESESFMLDDTTDMPLVLTGRNRSIDDCVTAML